MLENFVRPDGSPPASGFSQAVGFSGHMVAVSGQVPLDSDGKLVGANDIEAQTRQVFQNLKTALGAAGSGLDKLIKVTIYLTDIDDLLKFRAVRDEFVSTAAAPASTLVLVSGLVNPAFRVEIDALAIVQ
jgi:reactive intermediate/imine deaminase